jgi:hypothetical protein
MYKYRNLPWGIILAALSSKFHYAMNHVFVRCDVSVNWREIFTASSLDVVCRNIIFTAIHWNEICGSWLMMNYNNTGHCAACHHTKRSE